MMLSFLDKQIVKSSLEEWRIQEGRFSRQAWDRIRKDLEERLPEPVWQEAWEHLHNRWVESLLMECGGSYKWFESRNFNLISSNGQRHAKGVLDFLEKSRSELLRVLAGLVSEKEEVLLDAVELASPDDYYEYVSMQLPDPGEYPSSSAAFIDDGFPHVVFAHQELSALESVLVHELTHALLCHLNIPVWLNEGIAGVAEIGLQGSHASRLQIGSSKDSLDFWTEEKLQQFWTGVAFTVPDDTGRRSHELATAIVRVLSSRLDKFWLFVRHASFRDSGNAAARKYLKINLHELARTIISN